MAISHADVHASLRMPIWVIRPAAPGKAGTKSYRASLNFKSKKNFQYTADRFLQNPINNP
jgi:hypothetical protein